MRLDQLDSILLKKEPSDGKCDTICSICHDVLAKAERSASKIATQVRASEYEYSDFKLTFSISIRAYVNRLRIVSQAEQALNKEFDKNFNKSSYRAGIDFKEVFKWILSPLIAKELEVPANLEGTFLINCIFYRTANETIEGEETKGDGPIIQTEE